MKSLLIKDTTREERIRIVHQALWGACGIDCEFCSGCDNRGGGRIEKIYQPYIDGDGRSMPNTELPSYGDRNLILPPSYEDRNLILPPS